MVYVFILQSLSTANNVTVDASQQVRVLGVHLSSDLSLDKHVSSVIISANSNVSGARSTLIRQ